MQLVVSVIVSMMLGQTNIKFVLTNLILNSLLGKLLYFRFHDTLILFCFETMCVSRILSFIFPANHVSAILLISYFGNFMFLSQIFVMFPQQHPFTFCSKSLCFCDILWFCVSEIFVFP